eukprot:CAMPEP_0169083620 /NCGR_PEP_ID=MMETSP1015-20121227/12175_1 /TAXON_ID=342587 /ORGANISM="Karlodinium micrum, Strain CCMP2283" /LENGTH=160 /DNA_ID=CAMNT_0009143555 /DNA_START=73 /DNA_END=552 /DNA_ORIENTATION=-
MFPLQVSQATWLLTFTLMLLVRQVHCGSLQGAWSFSGLQVGTSLKKTSPSPQNMEQREDVCNLADEDERRQSLLARSATLENGIAHQAEELSKLHRMLTGGSDVSANKASAHDLEARIAALEDALNQQIMLAVDLQKRAQDALVTSENSSPSNCGKCTCA